VGIAAMQWMPRARFSPKPPKHCPLDHSALPSTPALENWIAKSLVALFARAYQGFAIIILQIWTHVLKHLDSCKWQEDWIWYTE
jgi:hypothetical protein